MLNLLINNPHKCKLGDKVLMTALNYKKQNIVLEILKYPDLFKIRSY